MKKLVFVLLLISTSAWAEWTRAGDNDNFYAYVDFSTIRKKGNKVKMWHLLEYKTARKVAGTTFLSMMEQYEYDCEEEQSRRLYVSWHSGHMGEGGAIKINSDPMKWEPVPPGSAGKSLWDVVCGKQ